MFSVPDALAGFYLVCFLVGLVFVLVSALLGASHDFLHLPGAHAPISADHGGFHLGAGHDASAGASLDAPSSDGHTGYAGGEQAAHAGSASQHGAASDRIGASPLNLMTVMAFLAWFGGAGYIFHALLGWWPPLTLPIALASGLLAGWLVYLFLVKVLLPGTATVSSAELEIVGHLGRVTIAIPPGGVGEVVYTLGGARHSDGAVSVDGQEIPEEAEVIIVGFEKGIAQVERYPKLSNE